MMPLTALECMFKQQTTHKQRLQTQKSFNDTKEKSVKHGKPQFMKQNTEKSWIFHRVSMGFPMVSYGFLWFPYANMAF